MIQVRIYILCMCKYMISAQYMLPVEVFWLDGGHGKEGAMRKALSGIISQETRPLGSYLLGFLNHWTRARVPTSSDNLASNLCSVSNPFYQSPWKWWKNRACELSLHPGKKMYLLIFESFLIFPTYLKRYRIVQSNLSRSSSQQFIYLIFNWSHISNCFFFASWNYGFFFYIE